MKKSSLSKFLMLAMIVGLSLISLLFFVLTNRTLNQGLSRWPADISYGFAQVIQTPFRWFSAKHKELDALLHTYQENQELKQTVQDFQHQEQLLKELEKENQDLRIQLGLQERFVGSQLLITEIIMRSTVSWLEVVTVDKGSRDEVSEDMLLLSGKYLVGKIAQVNDNSSQIRLLTNTVSQKPIAVKVGSGKEAIYGLLLGYDPDKKAIKLGRFNEQKEIAVGQPVTTSGYDGGLADVPIGEVVSVAHESDQSLVIYAHLQADMSHLEDLQLIGKGKDD